jgi:multicomponent Na+:H+ antiporter subunit C
MMEQHLLYALAAMVLFCLGLFGVIAQPNLVRKIMALNITSSGVFLLFVSIAQRDAGEFPDPVPHAMVLTGIVVSVSATAFALALARSIHRHSGQHTLAATPDQHDPPDPGQEDLP